jgi:selenide,water dikinase
MVCLVVGGGPTGLIALHELLAAGLEATLDLDALPVLPGAADLARRGARSSLHGANSRLARHITGEAAHAHAHAHAHWPFLFDPQTAGGLLLAVPPEVADAICAALHAAGDRLAVRIGSVVRPGEKETTARPGLIRIRP